MSLKYFYYCLVIIFVLAPIKVFGQVDVENELLKDLVATENGRYSINEYVLVNVGNQQFQIETTATAPTDVISRDNFLSIYTSFGTILLINMFEESGYKLADMEMTDLDELIGEPDITINFIMAKNGMQIQVITDEGTNRSTMKWDEVLGN